MSIHKVQFFVYHTVNNIEATNPRRFVSIRIARWNSFAEFAILRVGGDEY